MHHFIVIGSLSVIVTVGCAGPAPPAEALLRGVWTVAERTFARGDSSWSESPPGWYFFDERHYSVQEIRESGPRPLFTEATTELERLAAFDVFHAHTGTYEVEGSSLVMLPSLAKSPNSMDGSPARYTWRMNGDHLEITRVAPDGSQTRVTTLRRLGHP